MVTSIQQGLSPTPIKQYEDRQPNTANTIGTDLSVLNQNENNLQQKIIKDDLNAGKQNTSNGNLKNKTADFSELSNQLHSMLDNQDLQVQFSMDKESKKMIMQVIDSKTKEVVQQFPPEVSLKIARIVSNSLETGHVTNAKV
jgi:uncharacterized FlaG/YvyC family protein